MPQRAPVIVTRRRRIAVPGSGLKFYSWDMAQDENPASNGGAWQTHGSDGWQHWKTLGGKAQTPATQENFDDAYSFLSGFGPNYIAEATVFKQVGYTPPGSHEIEILGRVSKPDATHTKAYELLYGTNDIGNYIQIMKWDGTVAQTGPEYFTEIDNFVDTSPPALHTGDILRGVFSGPNISYYLIPVATGIPQLIATANDSSHATGQPGLSFFCRTGGTPANISVTRYQVQETA
jgi:hypothetical protein